MSSSDNGGVPLSANVHLTQWIAFQAAPPNSASDTSRIAAASKTSGHLEVWWVAEDGSVQGAFWVAGAPWTQYQLAPPKSAVPSAGVAAVSRSSTRMSVWWVAPDGSVRGAYWVEGKPWRPYSGLVAPAGSASTEGRLAAVSRRPISLEVWWIAKDGSVHGSFWNDDGNPWSQPYPVAPAGSASTTGALAAVSRRASSLEVWWIGQDGSVKGAFWNDDGHSWSQPYPVAAKNSASTTGALAALSKSATHLEVWWIAKDGSVQGAWWQDDGQPWRPPYPLAVAGNASLSGGIAAVSQTPTSMEVWWIGQDGSLQGAYWNQGFGWQPYPVAPSNTASTSGGVAAVAHGSVAMGAFWVGKNGAVQGVRWQAQTTPPGQPLQKFKGTLPYASEVYGVYKPLAGWIGRTNTLRLAAELTPDVKLADDDAFVGKAARDLTDALMSRADVRLAYEEGVLSPIGLVNLFREYFFEFDSFLGGPAGHIWLSPGGTVEVIESSTRKTLIEKTAEASEQSTQTTEESLTTQDDLADAVKEDNSNDTKLGVSASGGVQFAGIGHADASASFSDDTTRKSSSEESHKHTRTQSSKVTSQIQRNFKTTFRTVTETTDTTSRRYLLTNTGDTLVNYELRRKMRKVGVQVQHLRTALSWQAFADDPGKSLGLGELIHVVPAPDLTSLQKPDKIPPPDDKQIPFHFDVPFVPKLDDSKSDIDYIPIPENPCRGRNTSVAGRDDTIQFCFDGGSPAGPAFRLPPPPRGYELSKPTADGRPTAIVSIDGHGAQIQYTYDAADLQTNPDPAKNVFKLRLTFANFQGRKSAPFDAVLLYTPTDALKQEIAQKNKDAEDAYQVEVTKLQRRAYAQAVHDRSKLVRSIPQRPSDDLRAEERHVVYGYLIRQLSTQIKEPHLNSEIIRQMFDVDEMLYFVAPDYWRPGSLPAIGKALTDRRGRYPVPPQPNENDTDPLTGATVASAYSYVDSNYYLETANTVPPTQVVKEEFRINYPITEDSNPAPLGSSLGWLIQIDGDARRNQFLNAAWVKAVLPIRPGHELQAIAWLQQSNVEGEAHLDEPYPVQDGDPVEWTKPHPGTNPGDPPHPWTYREVLEALATKLQEESTPPQSIKNTLASETVFENGFDPLDTGFRPPDDPYQVFDQWIEVLPTDQVVAVAVSYDPKTGQQS